MLRRLFSRWRHTQRAPLPTALWEQTLSGLDLFTGLGDAERNRLWELSERFLREKRIETVSEEVPLTDRLRITIAATASLPILNLGLDWYEGFVSVLIYPGPFAPRREYTDEAGIAHITREVFDGEAWLRGPVILSAPDIATAGHHHGSNLVIHEFAHKLDMQNGVANGMPPLHRTMRITAWTEAFSHAFEHLNATLDHSAHTPIDPYAATSPAEFFAVLSEYFFEVPWVVHATYPAVYAQLVLFYRQDPLQRHPHPTHRHHGHINL